jgi:hypothetical protein
MNRNTWILVIVVAIVFAGGGYLIGKQSAASTAATGASAYAGRAGTAGYAGRAGGFSGAGGGATTGTIVATANGSFTIQLPTSTSTTATTGTKIVLFDNTTMVNELESVPATSLAVGQSVVVTGTANSDGSVTATSIQVRPAGAGGTAGGYGARAGTSATTGQ